MSSSFSRVAATSDRINEAMALRNKKQIDLARATGIDKGTINHYVSGKYEPKNEAIHKLAKALDVSEMWLWGYDVPIENTHIQKNNDIMADIIVRMRTDEVFLSVVNDLYALDAEKLEGVQKMLQAFTK